MVKGVDFTDTESKFCESCTLGKQHKFHSTEPATHRASQPGERLHNDLYRGGGTLPGVGGYRYGSVVIDDATRMRFPIVLKSKDQICEELPIIMQRIAVHTGRPIKSLRTDDGPEFAKLKTYLDQMGIFREKSALYAQDQDGVLERSIRTIVERARTMTIHANLPVHLWPEAMAAAVYITNRLPTKALNNQTPYEAWHNEKPDLSNLRVYGCDAYVVDYHAKSKGKMAPRSWTGTLVGYEAKNQWRIYDGKTVHVRRDVIFNESSLTYKKSPKITPIEQNKDTFDLAGLASVLEPVGVPKLAETSVPVGESVENQGDQEDSPLDNALDTVNRLLAEPNDAINSHVDEDIDDQISNPNSVDYQEDANPLILDHPREKTRHNYKDLHQRGFSKIAKTTVPHHGIVVT